MRIEQLTFTRFVAAISIVIYHYGKESKLFYNEYLSFIFNQANFGVSYFFILSGFVMIIAYGEKEHIKFYDYILNRLARIYPIYFLVVILYAVKESIKGNDVINDSILHMLMLQSWVPEKAITLNYPGWSLSVEMFFYITFPFIFNYFYKKKSLINISLWIITFWFLSQILFYLIIEKHITNLAFYNTKDMTFHPLMHLNEFLIGNLAGMYFMSCLKTKSRNFFVIISFLILLLIIILKYPSGLNYHNGLLAVVFIPLILFISLSNDKFTNFLNKKVFVFLGEISFGIYILQDPVFLLFSDKNLKKHFGLYLETDNTFSFSIRLIMLILIASISYFYFEKPIRNKIKNISPLPRASCS